MKLGKTPFLRLCMKPCMCRCVWTCLVSQIHKKKNMYIIVQKQKCTYIFVCYHNKLHSSYWLLLLHSSYWLLLLHFSDCWTVLDLTVTNYIPVSNTTTSAETNTTDIRIFVRFAIFEHNLCYSTIRLRPCGFAHVYFFDYLEL